MLVDLATGLLGGFLQAAGRKLRDILTESEQEKALRRAIDSALDGSVPDVPNRLFVVGMLRNLIGSRHSPEGMDVVDTLTDLRAAIETWIWREDRHSLASACELNGVDATELVHAIGDRVIHNIEADARANGPLTHFYHWLSQNSRFGPHPAGYDRSPHAWAQAADRDFVWRLVPESPERVRYRELAQAFAESLGRRNDTLIRQLRLFRDPWWDHDLVPRLGQRVGWLLKELSNDMQPRPSADPLRGLEPAEALLACVLPMLYQVRHLEALSNAPKSADIIAYLRGEPVEDVRVPKLVATAHRQHDEALQLLTRRRVRGRESADDPATRWLVHQWILERHALDRQTTLTLTGYLDEPEIRELENIQLANMMRLLGGDPGGLRRPADTGLAAHRTLFPGRLQQRVRERLLGYLFAVAHAFTVEAIRLDDTVVGHLGVPHPVDLTMLLEAVRALEPHEGDDGAYVLHAECEHEAILVSLRRYAAHIDHMLRSVSIAAKADNSLAHLQVLRTWVSSDRIRPAGRKELDGASFTLSDKHIRKILTDRSVYRDSALAIRELYQNALDACRFREAMVRLDGTDGGWTGAIVFTEGADDDGRDYIECDDNGIGMEQHHLRDLFATLGRRYHDSAAFVELQERWRAAGIAFHPVSRFGIGVASYFMLADEIVVRSRHASAQAKTWMATIVGAAHLFRIESCPESAEPGTRVRLYLKDSASRIDVSETLRNVLGIADYHTSVRTRRGRVHTWHPNAFADRDTYPSATFAIRVDKPVIPGPRSGDGQVLWCAGGGALLVDGIYVQRGLGTGLRSPGRAPNPIGFVVNLCGRASGKVDMTIDRTEVLNDVSSTVLDLARASLQPLLDHEHADRVLSLEWLLNVMISSPQLADVVADALTGSRRLLLAQPERDTDDRDQSKPRSTIEIRLSAGVFPGDLVLITQRSSALDRSFDWPGRWTFGELPDHLLLWRLLAQRHLHPALVAEIERICPAVVSIAPSVARPSDDLLLARSEDGGYRADGEPAAPGHVLAVARRMGISPRTVAVRAAHFDGATAVSIFSDQDRVEDAHLRILNSDLAESGAWLDHGSTVSPEHLIRAYHELGLSLATCAEILVRYGMKVDFDTRAISVEPGDAVIVAGLAPSQRVPAGRILHVSVQHNLPVERVLARLAVYGMEVSPLPDLVTAIDAAILRDVTEPDGRVLAGQLVRAAQQTGMNVQAVADRFKAFGYEPAALSLEPEPTDVKLLSRDSDGEAPWLDPDSPILPGHVLLAHHVTELPIDYVVARLRAYGYEVPDDLDEVLSRVGWPGNRDQLLAVIHEDAEDLRTPLFIDEPVSSGHMVSASLRLSQPAETIIYWLEALGFMVAPVIRTIRTEPGDSVLLSLDLDGERPYLDAGGPFTLHRLLRCALHRQTTLGEVAGRLRELGLDLPELGDVLHRALPRIPRQPQ